MIAPDIGAVIGGLRIDAVAGRGGMGVVYRAHQLALDRTVAMKIVNRELAGDPEFRERFRREARIAASLDHPHVVPVYHAGEDDGNVYLTMRFVEGTDLASMIAGRGRVEPRDAVEVVAQIADALDAAHARGLVHRDVKPANILVTRPGGRWHAYLTDFGISKDLRDAGITGSGLVVGSLSYISPEQLQGAHVDGRADQYSLACALFQALTGEVPFPRETTAAQMFAHMSAPAPALGEISPALRGPLEPVLAKALAKNPADRYPTAGEFSRAALAAVSQMDAQRAAQVPVPAAEHGRPGPLPPGAGPRPGPVVPAPRPTQRRGPLAAPVATGALTLWGAAGLALALVAATFGVLWYRGQPHDPAENRAVVDTAATAEVTQQVGKAIETIYSYDFAHLDEAEESGRAVITPEFEQTFTQLFTDVRAKASQQQAVVTAKVLHVGARELTDDTAVLLVFVDQTAGRAVGDAAPEPLAGTLMVTAKAVGGVWKIAAVSTE